MSFPAIINATLIFKTNHENLNVFKKTPLSKCELIIKGTYRSIMAIWTGINKKYFYPELSVLETVPYIQGFFDSATYYLGLNPNFPYIRQFYIPEPFFSSETIKIPYINYSIRKPQWPFSVYHASTSSVINSKFLEKHRLENEFSGGGRALEKAFDLCKAVFVRVDKSDFLLTCGPQLTIDAHSQIMKAFKGLDNIIQQEGSKLINRWENLKEVDLSAEMRYFSSSIITQVIFGNSENYQELSDAVHFMNYHIINEILGIPGDKEKFDSSCKTFRDITEAGLKNKENLPLFNGSSLTKAQNQALCFFLYFAGQETTAFALAHEFARLLLEPKTMADIRSSIKTEEPNNNLVLKEFINETLLKIPPVDGISRLINSDAYLSFKDSKGNSYGQLLLSEERILAHISGTAKIQQRYQDASIFGGGKHQCIGRNMALKEMTLLPIIILQALELTTNETTFRYKSQTTNQAEPFFIKVKSSKPNFS